MKFEGLTLLSKLLGAFSDLFNVGVLQCIEVFESLGFIGFIGFRVYRV